MAQRIVIIQGHPDQAQVHFCHALAEAYTSGARASGISVDLIDVAALDFPVLRRKEDWDNAVPVAAIREAQEKIAAATHLALFYPLWLGAMPALLKAFLEQVFRPGFGLSRPEFGKGWKKLLTGKSARIVVTMGMPACIYRWYFGAHSLKSLERNILAFCGIGPIAETLVGSVETCSHHDRLKWVDKLRELGRKGV